MTNDDEKKRWKDDAEQLKKDLDSRPKDIQKREVQIRMGTGKSINKQPPSKNNSPSSTKEDDFMRRQLGL
ncbi:MAG: hypothetical protein VW378_03350 [bacterium]